MLTSSRLGPPIRVAARTSPSRSRRSAARSSRAEQAVANPDVSALSDSFDVAHGDHDMDDDTRQSQTAGSGPRDDSWAWEQQSGGLQASRPLTAPDIPLGGSGWRAGHGDSTDFDLSMDVDRFETDVSHGQAAAGGAGETVPSGLWTSAGASKRKSVPAGWSSGAGGDSPPRDAAAALPWTSEQADSSTSLPYHYQSPGRHAGIPAPSVSGSQAWTAAGPASTLHRCFVSLGTADVLLRMSPAGVDASVPVVLCNRSDTDVEVDVRRAALAAGLRTSDDVAVVCARSEQTLTLYLPCVAQAPAVGAASAAAMLSGLPGLANVEAVLERAGGQPTGLLRRWSATLSLPARVRGAAAEWTMVPGLMVRVSATSGNLAALGFQPVLQRLLSADGAGRQSPAAALPATPSASSQAPTSSFAAAAWRAEAAAAPPVSVRSAESAAFRSADAPLAQAPSRTGHTTPPPAAHQDRSFTPGSDSPADRPAASDNRDVTPFDGRQSRARRRSRTLKATSVVATTLSEVRPAEQHMAEQAPTSRDDPSLIAAAPAPSSDRSQLHHRPDAAPGAAPGPSGLMLSSRAVYLPAVAPGSRSEARVQVCNTSDLTLQVAFRLVSVQGADHDAGIAFSIRADHASVTLRPRSYCMLPLLCAPAARHGAVARCRLIATAEPIAGAGLTDDEAFALVLSAEAEVHCEVLPVEQPKQSRSTPKRRSSARRGASRGRTVELRAGGGAEEGGTAAALGSSVGASPPAGRTRRRRVPASPGAGRSVASQARRSRPSGTPLRLGGQVSPVKRPGGWH